MGNGSEAMVLFSEDDPFSDTTSCFMYHFFTHL
jgi:hypothetical protein